MKTPLQRIRRGASFLVLLVVISVIGYRYLAEKTWLDSLYMVVITISSVGFSEESSYAGNHIVQVLTILLIIFGMSAAAYTVGGFIQLMTEGEIHRALGKIRMTRDIQKLEGHIILCGYGRIGQILAQDLLFHNKSIVIIESNLERISEAANHELLAIQGNATEEEILEAAGIERAKTIVTCLPNDADNVFITLTAKQINPGIQVIARAEYATSEKKFIQAGASSVVLPSTIGAQRIARMITRPTTVDLMDKIIDKQTLDVELEELELHQQNKLVGKSVEDAEAHQRHGVLVLAVKQADGQMIFNPGADYVFQEKDTAIVMGKVDNIKNFHQRFAV